MKEVAFILYSHTDYSDLWEAFFDRVGILLPLTFIKYMFVNCEMSAGDAKKIPLDYKIVEYDQELYSDRINHCLEDITEEYLIIQHEDMILYDKPDKGRLENYLKAIKRDEELDFIKLIKGGDIDDEPCDKHDELFHSKKWLLAIQPTIWRTASLRKIFYHLSNKGIWELEEVAQQEECRKLGIKGVYCYNGEQQRGRHHWDSLVYPYIATAINKGKWNTSEYSSELEELFKEYEIDKSLRGTI